MAKTKDPHYDTTRFAGVEGVKLEISPPGIVLRYRHDGRIGRAMNEDTISEAGRTIQSQGVFFSSFLTRNHKPGVTSLFVYSGLANLLAWHR